MQPPASTASRFTLTRLRFLQTGVEILYCAAFFLAGGLVERFWAPPVPGPAGRLARVLIFSGMWLGGYVLFTLPGEIALRKGRKDQGAKTWPRHSLLACLSSGMTCLMLPMSLLIPASVTEPAVFAGLAGAGILLTALWLVLGSQLHRGRPRHPQPLSEDPSLRELQDFAARCGYLDVWCCWADPDLWPGPSPAGYFGPGIRTPARIVLVRSAVMDLGLRGQRALFAHELAHHACGHSRSSRLLERGISLASATLLAWVVVSRQMAGAGLGPGSLLALCVLIDLLWERGWSPVLLAQSRYQERAAHIRALEMTCDPKSYRQAMECILLADPKRPRLSPRLLDSHLSRPEVLELIDNFVRNGCSHSGHNPPAGAFEE